MPETSKKTVKRNTPQKKPVRKSKPQDKKPALKPKKTVRRRKATRKDFGQALLLTGIMIAVSAVISMAILGAKRGETQQTSIELAITEPSDTQEPEQSAATEIAIPEKPLVEIAAVEKPAVAVTKPTAPPITPPKVESPPPEKPQANLPKPEKVMRQGTLVFVIDDAGNNLQELEPFLSFPGPLTIAVLPGLPYSAEAARRIRAAGKEVFLHQPMEALGGQNPGPNAIYSSMSNEEIIQVLRQNLAEIGPVSGMNNHQGSKITMDRGIMETILTFCREQGLQFLDSRTTSQTAAPAAAQNLGIKIGERNIFIDNEQNRPSMSRYIDAGLALAAQKGSAVMIGHTWSPELAPLLADLHQDLTAQGFTLSTASEIIKK